MHPRTPHPVHLIWNDPVNVEDDDRQQIGKPVDRERWGMTPPTSDAYYNPLLNERGLVGRGVTRLARAGAAR